MCLPPMMLAGLAAQAASTYANNRANKEIRRKQGEYRQAEDDRQNDYYKKANSTLTDTMSKFNRPAQDQALSSTAVQRDASINATQAQPGDYTPVDSSAPAVVRSDIASRMADALAKGKGEIMARAKLGAYDGVQNTNAINLNRSGQDINKMADFSRGSIAVLPYEMNNALSAGRKWQNISDMMKMTGQGLGWYSMMQPAPLNYATTPSQVANVKSSMEESYPMTYTDPNDLVQARKLGMIR